MILHYITILLSFLSSCHNDWQNRPAVSDNMKDSKKRGVYICEYEALPNPMNINDSLIFDIKEVWLERQWRYKEKFEETDPMEGYQLIILTKGEIHKGFSRTWRIGIDFDRNIRLCGKSCLMTEFEKLPISNKEIWKVQAGSELNPEAEKIILGDFTLYKKMQK